MGSGIASRADRLRALHQGNRPVVMANVWDVSSALVVQKAGFPALATSSGAVVRSLGFEDGSHVPSDEAFSAIARMARAVDVPLSADVEDGYQLEAGELVARLLSAGAVGCNLEDTDHHSDAPLVDTATFAAKVAAVKEAGRSAGVDLVLNARTDVFLRRVGDEGARLDEALRRAAAYREAGADCIFVPGHPDDDKVITHLVEGVDGPLNLLTGPDPTQVARLGSFGVARISVGSSLATFLLTQLAARAAELAVAAGLGPDRG